ncbi:MAG: hypothetical protein EPN69_10290 [Rhodanobacter sp.]|nr:MAG: hypothetical protein EPN71_12665 [Rhodanobacter sp.]TAL91467.1 MAG: hypothetical protein EPN69_10290 [Rhodanobacter sp.]TAM42170.1 MAG: hypothetical protein EPN58_04065 [Rhodanobacter sp.]TAN26771.1 MAG: hypothetical protein EPN32_05935 [Rhodanobacter sp.]
MHKLCPRLGVKPEHFPFNGFGVVYASHDSDHMPILRGVQQGFLQQQWWYAATTGVPGFTRHHEAMVIFGARQCLAVFSPSNFLATKPELIDQTPREGGANLVRGAPTSPSRCSPGGLPA